MMIDVEMKDQRGDDRRPSTRSTPRSGRCSSPTDLITPDVVRGTTRASVTRCGRGAGRRSAPCAGASCSCSTTRASPRSSSRAIRRCGAGSCSRPRRPATTTPRSPSSTTRSPTRPRSRLRSPRNMLVRTRADADTVQARANDTDDARRRAQRRRAVRQHRLRGPRPSLRPLRREDPGRQTCTVQPDYRPTRLSPDRHRGPKSAQISPVAASATEDVKLA